MARVMRWKRRLVVAVSAWVLEVGCGDVFDGFFGIFWLPRGSRISLSLSLLCFRVFG